MRSKKSNKVIAFYTPDYKERTDFFGCASLGIVGSTTEHANAVRRFVIEPEAIEISGSYVECLHEARQIAKEERVIACIAVLGNLGNEDAFCRNLHGTLNCPVVGGGAAFELSSNQSGLIARGGEANLLFITDKSLTAEVSCKNIHTTELSRHRMTLGDSRTLVKIDGYEANGWLAEKKTELGFDKNDWEHVTLSDLSGINAHLSVRDNRIVSGKDLDQTMVLRCVKQGDVFEAMQQFYEDDNAIIFGCAGLKGLLERDLRTEALGLFLFGEICCVNTGADFGNLMLSKIRFASKS